MRALCQAVIGAATMIAHKELNFLFFLEIEAPKVSEDPAVTKRVVDNGQQFAGSRDDRLAQ